MKDFGVTIRRMEKAYTFGGLEIGRKENMEKYKKRIYFYNFLQQYESRKVKKTKIIFIGI